MRWSNGISSMIEIAYAAEIEIAYTAEG